jgi:hypothetical protein
MLRTELERVRVTPENYDAVLDTITARDQHREVLIGDVISHYCHDDAGGEETEVTVWHNRGRAAICSDEVDSEWGDWDERTQTITPDAADDAGHRVRLNRYGEALD